MKGAGLSNIGAAEAASWPAADLHPDLHLICTLTSDEGVGYLARQNSAQPRAQSYLVSGALVSTSPIIAFSLFGSKPRYTQGAIANLKLAEELYPGWVCRFYVDITVPTGVRRELERGAEVILMPRQRFRMEGMFWRFLVADSEAPRWMVRDADSRLNPREVAAVQEWVQSGRPFHVMRDHPAHRMPIMGCSFGGIRGAVTDMAKRIADWPHQGPVGHYGDDETFLATQIWPLVREQALQHDSFPDGSFGPTRPFPTSLKESDFHFIGERMDENDNCNENDRMHLLHALGQSVTDGRPGGQ
jgi:hypothetical protein